MPFKSFGNLPRIPFETEHRSYQEETTFNIWALISLFPCLVHYIPGRNFSLILSPSCFAVCGHHLSPRIAIVFSLLIPNFSMSHSSLFLISSTHPVPPFVHFTFSHYVFYSTYCFATRAHLCIFLLLLATTGVPLRSGRSRPPTPNRSFSVFA